MNQLLSLILYNIKEILKNRRKNTFFFKPISEMRVFFESCKKIESKTSNTQIIFKYIKTFGCQMNVYDSSRMADILSLKGYEQTDNIEDCDVFIYLIK